MTLVMARDVKQGEFIEMFGKRIHMVKKVVQIRNPYNIQFRITYQNVFNQLVYETTACSDARVRKINMSTEVVEMRGFGERPFTMLSLENEYKEVMHISDVRKEGWDIIMNANDEIAVYATCLVNREEEVIHIMNIVKAVYSEQYIK